MLLREVCGCISSTSKRPIHWRCGWPQGEWPTLPTEEVILH